MKKKVFKIFVMIFCLVMPVFLLAGCNKAVFDTDYNFSRALVYEKGEWKEYKISKWDDYENDMICIWTSDGQMIYTSSNNIILYKS